MTGSVSGKEDRSKLHVVIGYQDGCILPAQVSTCFLPQCSSIFYLQWATKVVDTVFFLGHT